MFVSDLSNMKFGKLIVVGRDYSYKSSKHTKWICKCECGNVKSIFRNSLISGDCKSCGCQANKGTKGINKTHGLSQSRIYKEWARMKARCRSNSKDAKTYYNRGICVCAEWQNNFDSFYSWAINNGYNDSLSLDRIDNNKGYSPNNCQWISIKEQQSHKSNTLYVFYQGKEWCLHTLCNQLNFPYKTAQKRYYRMKQKGLPIDSDKLFAPIQENKIAIKYRK